MGLKTSDATGSFEGGGIKVTDGVYANLKTIEKVRDLSGKKIEFMNNKVFDLALEVQFADDKFPQIFVGNLKTDASGEVTGWGGAFLVARVFAMADVDAELDINNRFKAADLKKLIGKELYHITYTAGTYKKDDGTQGTAYKSWNMVFDGREDPDEIGAVVLDEWQKSRDKGYPNNYEYPNSSKAKTMSTGGRSVAGKSDVTASTDLDDMDDDLPF